jgi:hypothetical protein
MDQASPQPLVQVIQGGPCSTSPYSVEEHFVYGSGHVVKLVDGKVAEMWKL